MHHGNTSAGSFSSADESSKPVPNVAVAGFYREG